MGGRLEKTETKLNLSEDLLKALNSYGIPPTTPIESSI